MSADIVVPNGAKSPTVTVLYNNVDMSFICLSMGLLLDTQNCGLRMHRECRERFPRHQFKRKPPVSDPGMHHVTCVTHVP